MTNAEGDLCRSCIVQLTPISLALSSPLSVRSSQYRVIFLIPKCNGLLTGSGMLNSDIVSLENSRKFKHCIVDASKKLMSIASAVDE